MIKICLHFKVFLYLKFPVNIPIVYNEILTKSKVLLIFFLFWLYKFFRKTFIPWKNEKK